MATSAETKTATPASIETKRTREKWKFDDIWNIDLECPICLDDAAIYTHAVCGRGICNTCKQTLPRNACPFCMKSDGEWLPSAPIDETKEINENELDDPVVRKAYDDMIEYRKQMKLWRIIHDEEEYPCCNGDFPIYIKKLDGQKELKCVSPNVTFQQIKDCLINKLGEPDLRLIHQADAPRPTQKVSARMKPFDALFLVVTMRGS